VGKVRKASWYDNEYAKREREHRRALVTTSEALQRRWTALASALPEKARILDLGCGTGRFAEVLRSQGNHCRYLGVDFSRTALAIAKDRNIPGAVFQRRDLRRLSPTLASKFGVIVACEVFEHLAEDRKLIAKLAGRLVVFTIPTFDSRSHVRWFPTEQDVRDRYDRLLYGLTVTPVGKSWLCRGVARAAPEVHDADSPFFTGPEAVADCCYRGEQFLQSTLPILRSLDRQR